LDLDGLNVDFFGHFLQFAIIFYSFPKNNQIQGGIGEGFLSPIFTPIYFNDDFDLD
jgi:hypothetical protein